MMNVILQEDVQNLGTVGDLVSVKDGYGRNYLIPQRKAVFASVRSIKELDHQKRLAQHRRTQATAAAELARRKIESLSICMTAKVAPVPPSHDGVVTAKDHLQKLFGGITNRDLVRVLKDSDVIADPKRVTFNDTIRTVGKYEAKIRLDGGITAVLPFWVIPEGVGDVDAEKKRVEAAQEAVIKEAAAAKIKAAQESAQAKKDFEAAAAAKVLREEADAKAADERAAAENFE